MPNVKSTPRKNAQITDLAQRLGVLRRTLRAEQNELERRLGLYQGAWSAFEKGRRTPTTEQLLAICATLDVSADWLLFGEGEPTHGADLSVREPLVSVPLRTSQAGSAGDPTQAGPAEVVDWRPYPERELRQLTSNPHNLERVRVVGDAMEPTFRSGDEVLVDFTAPPSLHDGIYAVRLQVALTVKRLQFTPDGRVLILSDNPAYHTMEHRVDDQGEDFQILGRVVAARRRY